MSGLYQKPGRGSSEWDSMVAFAFTGLAFVIGGFIACAFEWPGQMAGYLLIGLGPVVGLPLGITYTLSRAKVKAAAEQNLPPKSRVC